MLFWMFGALVFLLIIDIIILAVWETNDPLYRTLKQVRSQPEYECFQVSHIYLNKLIIRKRTLSGQSDTCSSPGLEHCIVFFGKTLSSHSASLHPVV